MEKIFRKIGGSKPIKLLIVIPHVAADVKKSIYKPKSISEPSVATPLYTKFTNMPNLRRGNLHAAYSYPKMPRYCNFQRIESNFQ